MGFESDVRDPAWAGLYGPAQPEAMPPNEAFLADWLLRTCEIVDRYRPQLVWFDWWIEQPAFEPYLRAFAAYYYNRGARWGRQVAINYKNAAFREGTAVFDVERGQLGDIAGRFWQADTAVARNSWGYVGNLQYKDPVEIIEGLVDVVSKNGALLLNIGPTADGRIPEEDRRTLETIGDWLRVNGEAVYGTRPWRQFGEGPTVVGEGGFTDDKRTPFGHRDVRYTQRGKVLYAVLLAPAHDRHVRLRALGAEAGGVRGGVPAVTVLGRAGQAQWKRDIDALEVTLPPGVRDGLPAGPVTLRVEAQP
jgi:alpha-L-fucosidase